MKKLKVVTIVGTRPEIIRLSRVLARLDEHTNHVLVHTGQNYDYELNEIFFKEMGLKKPDYMLEAVGDSVAETVGKIIHKADMVLEKEQPDAVLILGDTNSCLSVIAAKKRKIPIFHMEAGNRCFDERVPEESNRRLVDHLSDINLPYSKPAREHLIREGIAHDRIIKTGSPMHEVLNHYGPKIEKSGVLKKLKLKENDYFLVSCHREENVDSDKNLGSLVEILNTLSEKFGKRIIVSTHPRTQNRLNQKGCKFHSLVELLKPLGFIDYVHLQKRAHAVLSDSGTITEESSILNFPALNIREAHERMEGMEEGSVMMVGLSVERIIQGLMILKTQPRGENRLLNLTEDYRASNVSDKVIRIILSYVDYVNRMVWQR